MTELEQYSEITKANEILANSIQTIVKDVENCLVQSVPKIVQTISEMANACHKPFLTPRQYHLMLHGKKRVRKKYLNVARKRLDKLVKGE